MPTPRNRKMSDDSFSFPFFFRHGSAPRLSFFSFEMQISTRRGVRPSFPSTSRDARDHPSLARPSPLRVEENWTKKISDRISTRRGAIFPTASIPPNSKRRRNRWRKVQTQSGGRGGEEEEEDNDYSFRRSNIVTSGYSTRIPTLISITVRPFVSCRIHGDRLRRMRKAQQLRDECRLISNVY